MNTEITEEYKEWVFYDAECAICRGSVRRLRERLHRHGIGVAPLQEEWVRERLGLASDGPLDEMKVLTERGEVFGGADAMIYLARYLWWGWGLRVMAQLPGARFALRRAYARFARQRHCVKGGCKL